MEIVVDDRKDPVAGGIHQGLMECGVGFGKARIVPHVSRPPHVRQRDLGLGKIEIITREQEIDHIGFDHAPNDHDLHQILGIGPQQLSNRHRQRFEEFPHIGAHHRSSLPVPTPDQPLGFENLHCLAHGARRNAELAGQLAF